MYLSRFEASFDNSDKSLLITLSHGFRNRKKSIARIGSWNDQLDFELVQGDIKVFYEVLKGPTILNPALANIEDHPVKSFREHLPDWVGDLDIYEIDEYNALRLLSISPAAQDLYHSNLNLFRVLAHRNGSAIEVGELLSRPHREIVEWLYPQNHGKYGPDFIRKWLRDRLFSFEKKIDIGFVDLFLKRLLKGEIAQNNPRILEGIGRIPVQALQPEILVLRPSVVMNRIGSILSDEGLPADEKKRIINDLVENCSSLSCDIRQLADILEMDTVERQGWPRQVYRIGTLKGLRRYHDRLLGRGTIASDALLISRAEEYRDETLPEPWIPGNECIRPLTTFEDFEKESEVMEHCIAYLDYFEKALCGQTCYYSVHAGKDRCTLELSRNQKGKYEIGQLRGHDNRDPQVMTRQLVEKWIEKNYEK